MLNKLSAERKKQDYMNLVAQILQNHGVSYKTHLISVDGNIFPKPAYMVKQEAK